MKFGCLAREVLTSINIQFSFGGMAQSTNILRMIKETSKEDETKLQTSFNDYDRCTPE